MMDEKRFTLDEVKGAFERLEEFALRQGVDASCTWAIHMAQEDVLAILAGEWRLEDEPGGDQPEPIEEGPDVARCPACNQSLKEVQRSMFACPTCYGTFGQEEVEAALRPF
jgi:hypothetical protein